MYIIYIYIYIYVYKLTYLKDLPQQSVSCFNAVFERIQMTRWNKVIYIQPGLMETYNIFKDLSKTAQI